MMYLLIFIFITCILNLALLYHFPKPPTLKEHQRYDACIVLGCPTKADGTISRMQKSRMKKAIALFKSGHITHLIISGAGVRNYYTEAQIMANYAFQKGIPQGIVYLEDKARNTYDNLYYTSQICVQNNLMNIVVVSSRFHIRRANFFVKKFFTSYAMCPTDDKEKMKHYIAEYVRMWNTLRIEYQIKQQAQK